VETMLKSERMRLSSDVKGIDSFREFSLRRSNNNEQDCATTKPRLHPYTSSPRPLDHLKHLFKTKRYEPFDPGYTKLP
jgi:hypothetical protein